MFSREEEKILETVDARLVSVLRAARARMPFKVIEGHRGEARQNKLFAEGKTKVRFPNSKHNSLPSLAVDIAPLPIDWNNRQRFAELAAIVFDEAKKRNVRLRWGGDWNRNGDWRDETFLDMPHFEIDERGGVAPKVAGLGAGAAMFGIALFFFLKFMLDKNAKKK